MKLRRVFRWLAFVVLGLVVLVLVARIALPFALPGIVARLVRPMGLACTWQRFQLSISRGRLALWDLELKPLEGDTPRAHLHYLEADVSVRSLFSGRPLIRRVSLDGLDLWVDQQEPLGSIDFGSGAPEPKSPAPEKPPPGPTPVVDLTLPFEVEALRLQDVQLRMRDRRRSPEFELTGSMDLRVSDVGSSTRPARVDLVIHNREGLDAFRLDAEGRSGGRHLEARVRVRAGVRPPRFEALLRTAGIRPAADRLGLTLDAEARAEPAANATDVRLTARVHGVRVTADGVEAAAVDEVALEADPVGPSGAIATVAVRGVRGAASRLADGALRAAGLDFLPGGAATEAPPPEPAPTEAEDGAPWNWTIVGTRLHDVRLAFHDAGVDPPVELALEVDELAAGALTCARPIQDTGLRGVLRVPGIVGEMRLEGAVAPLEPHPLRTLTCRMTGLQPQKLDPYLKGARLATTIRNGELAFEYRSVDGTDASERGLKTGGWISNLRLQEGGEELLTIERAGLVASALGPDVWRADTVELAGVRLALRGDAEGAFHYAGLRTIPAEGPAQAPWSLNVSADVGVRNLVIGAPAAEPAQLRIRCAAPGAGDVRLEGSLASRGAPLDLEAKLRLDGRALSLAPLEPRLRAAGLEPRLEDGTLACELGASVRRDGERLDAAASVAGLSLRSGGDEVLALGRLQAEWRAGADGGGRATVAVEKPVVHVARDAEGGLLVPALRIPPPPPATAAAPPAAPRAAPPPPAPGSANGETPAPPGPVAMLERFQLSDATVAWKDAMVSPPVEVAALLQADAAEVPLGSGPWNARFGLTLAVRGALERLALQGTFAEDAGKTAFALGLEGQGLRAGPLQAYLPPGLDCELRSGRLRARLEGELTKTSVRASLGDVELGDGESGPLLRVGAFTAHGTRPGPRALTVEELSLAGVEVAARRTGRGLHAAGLVFGPAPPEPAAPPPPPPSAPPAAAPPPAPLAKGPLDALRVERLSLRVDRFQFLDETVPDAKPFDVALHLRSEEPLQVLVEGVEEMPALNFRLTGAAKPVVGALDLKLRCAPMGSDPGLDLRILLEGIRGAGLTEAFPALRERLDGTGLEDGRLEARLRGALRARRRGRFGFDLSEGFGLLADLSGVTLRTGREGPVLAGLESVMVDVARVDDRQVRVREIEIVKPVGEVHQRPEGVLFAGILWKSAPKAPATPAPASPAPASPPAPAPAPPESERELRIDLLSVQGIDFRYRDDSVKPTLFVPLEDLDLQVRNYSTRSKPAPVPMDFQLALRAGAVELPPRESSMIGGLLSAVTRPGQRKPSGPERLPLFQEITTRGRFALQPALRGWATIVVEGLELTGFRGLSDRAGVKLGDGVATTKIDLQADGRSIRVKSVSTFENLSLSEPAGGPISSVLRLPAPLDTVLFVLDRGNGEHRVPLDFTLQENQMSVGAATEVLITTLGKLIADAIARSPLRITSTVTGTLTGLVGLALPQQAAAAEPSREPIPVAFPPGDITLSPDERSRVRVAAERLKQDPLLGVTLRHQLHQADVPPVSIRANPDPAAAAELRVRLLNERDELERRRAELSGEVRAALAFADRAAAERAAGTIREVDGQRAKVETGLDNVTELLVPGARRRQALRTRFGLRQLGDERLEAVHRALREAGIAEERIEVRRPSVRTVEGDDGGGVLLLLRRMR